MYKPHLILWHGALGCPDQLKPLATLLSKDFDVHVPSFRGHGGHDYDGPLRMSDFVHDIDAYLKKHDIESCFLFGYSMGGFAALRFAFDKPEAVKKVVTYGTKWDWNPESAYKETSMLDPEKMEEKIPAYTAILKNRFYPLDWKKSVKKTADMMKNLGENPLLTKNEFSQINSPICITVGSNDKMVSKDHSRKVSESMPQGSFFEWENWDHPIEKADVSQLGSFMKTYFLNYDFKQINPLYINSRFLYDASINVWVKQHDNILCNLLAKDHSQA